MPPCDIGAERAVVSAALLSVDALGVARDTLRPDQFFDASTRLVYEALCSVDDSGSSADIVTVTTALRDRGVLEKIGGTSKIIELFDASPNIAHIADHCAIVANKARLRRIIDVCRVHAVTAYGDVGDVVEYCSMVERDILAATDGASKADAPQTIGEILKEEMPKITERQLPDYDPRTSKNNAFKTNIYELDEKLWGGLDPNMYIIAARPGMGKTAFAGTFALNIARGHIDRDGKLVGDGKGVVFFSCEMPKNQLAMRFLSHESLVDYRKLKTDRLTPEEWDSVLLAHERLSQYPLSIHHEPGAHVQRVKSVMRREFARMKRTPGLGIIDYVQLLRGTIQSGGNREQEVASISRYCMELPKEFSCPIVLLSQLNRELEKRPNKRPIMSDLRESGSLEQDAYGIFFLYRDEYYNPDTEAKGEVEIIVAKNRNGEPGTVVAKFDAPCTRFCSVNQELHDDIDDIDGAIC